jgi:hypothetical protein
MPLPRYPWGKRPEYPLDRRLGGPRAGVDDMEKLKFLTLLGLDPLAVQPVASHYTGYDTVGLTLIKSYII